MKRIIARILKALRSVLSRFRSTPAASPKPDIHEIDDRLSEPPQSSGGGVCEAPGDEPPEAGTSHTSEASKAEESVEVVGDHGNGDGREGKGDSEAAGAETADTSVQKEHPTTSEDAAAERETGKEASGGEIASPPPLRDDHVQEEQASGASGGGAEPNPTLQQPQRDAEVPAEPPVENEERSSAPKKRDLAGDAVDATCSSPYEEASDESSEGPVVLDRVVSDGCEDDRRPSDAEDPAAGGVIAEIESAEETAHQEEGPLSAAPPEPPDVDSEPVIDASTANASEQGAPESDIPLSIPPDAPSEDLRRQEDSSGEQAAASEDASASSSGAVDRSLVEDRNEESAQRGARAPSPRHPTPPEDAREYAVAVQDVSPGESCRDHV